MDGEYSAISAFTEVADYPAGRGRTTVTGTTTAALATGGEYGFRLDKAIALAMVKPDLANVGEKLKVDILGKMYEATILEESPYDVENKLLRA